VSFTAESVANALAGVRERITAAGGDGSVAILPVTKGFGPEAIEAAVAAGAPAVGENYVQELVAKLDELHERAVAPPGVHLIGQLQTNKVRQTVGRVDVYETVDRLSLARELAKRAPGATVLIQVDTTGQPGKGGCPLDDVDALVDTARQLGLAVAGLMTVGPTPEQFGTDGPEAARAGFRAVRAMADRLALGEVSMGMSDDLEVAVQEGSTQVRVGSALFGSRPVPLGRDRPR